MIEFHQTIQKSDYKKAIAYHYFAYKYTLINPIIGVLIIVFSVYESILNIESFDNKYGILFLIGLFLTLRPYLYILNVYKSHSSSKLLSNETFFRITNDDKIQIENNGNISITNLKDLHSYYINKRFVYLYAARNQYLILDRTFINDDQISQLIDTLNLLQVKNRK